MIFPRLGIFGWQERDENLLLASLLTGGPVLLIGSHGTAKTGLFMKIAEALAGRFALFVYPPEVLSMEEEVARAVLTPRGGAV